MEKNYRVEISLLTLLHSERPKLHTILAFRSAIRKMPSPLSESSGEKL